MNLQEYINKSNRLPKDLLGNLLAANEASLPTRKNEDWKYFPHQKIDFQLSANTELSLDDIIAKQKLSGFDLVVFKDSELIKDETGLFASLSQEAITQFKPSMETDIDVLNLACSVSPSVLRIESKPKNPIQLLWIHTAEKASHSFLDIQVADGAEAEIFENHFCVSNKNTASLMMKISLGKESKLSMYRSAEVKAGNVILNNTHIVQGESSNLEIFSFDSSDAVIRRRDQVDLDAEKAHAELRAFYILKNDSVLNHKADINHLKPNSTSGQLFKGFLNHKSKMIFDGKVFVAKDAQHTNSEQLNKNVLFSDLAEVDTKPQLEIYADDVKCAHGATLGGFEADELFYFQSRAIPKEKALQMMAVGYAEDVLMDITNKQVHDRFMEQFLDSLNDFEVNVDEL